MSQHSHDFVETYDGLVGFGLDRETDLATVRIYLQKFSDDEFTGVFLPRLEDRELEELFDLMSRLLRKHLSEGEYHGLFLKDPEPHHHD